MTFGSSCECITRPPFLYRDIKTSRWDFFFYPDVFAVSFLGYAIKALIQRFQPRSISLQSFSAAAAAAVRSPAPEAYKTFLWELDVQVSIAQVLERAQRRKGGAWKGDGQICSENMTSLWHLISRANRPLSNYWFVNLPLDSSNFQARAKGNSF